MAMTLITTNTSSNAASSSFTSSIDSTYKLYIFKFIDINPATDSQYLTFQCNATDSTSYDETITSTAFGSYDYESGGTAALGYAGNEDQDNDDQVYQKLAYEIGNGSDEGCAGTMWLFNPSSTTYVKHFYSRINNYAATDRTIDTYYAGYINTTTAIDDIQFKMASGNFDGTIKMYGVG